LQDGKIVLSYRNGKYVPTKSETQRDVQECYERVLKNLIGHEGKEVLTENQVSAYVKRIDELNRTNKLKRVHYHMESKCGGGLSGYYFQNKLVFIDATHSAGNGFSRKQVYLNDTTVYRIVYQEHFVDWSKVKDGSVKETIAKACGDTTYTVDYLNAPDITKMSGKKYLSLNYISEHVSRLQDCALKMREELDGELKSH